MGGFVLRQNRPEAHLLAYDDEQMPVIKKL
jgi:hypothetical protein